MVLLLPIPQIQMLYTPHPETHTQCKTITGCVNVQFTQPYSYSNGKLNSVVFWTLLWHQKWINVIKTDINTQTTIWGNHHVTFQSYCFCFLLSNKISKFTPPQTLNLGCLSIIMSFQHIQKKTLIITIYTNTCMIYVIQKPTF